MASERLCTLVLLVLLLLLPSVSSAAELRGRATVTDGDTIAVAGQTVRLFGKIISCSRRRCLSR